MSFNHRFKCAPVALVIIFGVALSGCQTVGEAGGAETLFAMSTPDKNTTASVSSDDGRPFADIISRHALANNVPIELAHAVVEVESTYNPKARGSVGEVGLMQLRPATARMVGYSGSTNALYDPETNIKYGMKYLGEARRLAGGDTCGTILRYNAGHGAKRMNPISAAYCEKVRKKLGKR